MFKKIIFFIAILILATSCADTFDSVKRGLSGAKNKSADEFLVKKKDPLVLPPDYENLPSPSTTVDAEEEISVLEKTLQKTSSVDSDTSSASSTEESILNKIRKK